MSPDITLRSMDCLILCYNPYTCRIPCALSLNKSFPQWHKGHYSILVIGNALSILSLNDILITDDSLTDISFLEYW
jgi:hypothetical protein